MKFLCCRLNSWNVAKSKSKILTNLLFKPLDKRIFSSFKSLWIIGGFVYVKSQRSLRFLWIFHYKYNNPKESLFLSLFDLTLHSIYRSLITFCSIVWPLVTFRKKFLRDTPQVIVVLLTLVSSSYHVWGLRKRAVTQTDRFWILYISSLDCNLCLSSNFEN